MRLPLLLLLPLAVYTVITPISFEEWKTRFGKSYPNATEDAHRRELFQANLKNLLNSNCDTCGITKFAADTPQEISSRTNLLLPPNIEELARKQAQESPIKVGTSDSIATSQAYLKLAAASSLDWRDQGAVTSIKAQGSCGTCWSFTTVAMCESSLILKGNAWNNKLYEVDLSEQYLLKCTPGSSCNGGYLEKSIDKALQKGLPTDQQFPYNPYSSSNSGVCSTSDLLPISNATRISKYYTTDDTIITMLAAGPIAAAVSAVGWQNYNSGVFQCQPNSAINHAVLLIGYTSDYWIIKNSWGKDWGQSGYIYVTRNPNNNCGIGTAVHMLSQQWVVFGLIMMLLALLI